MVNLNSSHRGFIFVRASTNIMSRNLALIVVSTTLLFLAGMAFSVSHSEAAGTLIKTGQCSVAGRAQCYVSFSPNAASPFPCYVKSTAISAAPYQLHNTFVTDIGGHQTPFPGPANTSQVQYTPSGVTCTQYTGGQMGVEQFTNSSRVSTYRLELYSGTY